TDKTAHQKAQALLKQMIRPNEIAESPVVLVSPLFKKIHDINQRQIQLNEKINQMAIYMNSHFSTEENKQTALYQLFFDAIASGDIEIFRLLKAYSSS
ncbi:MAG TPA: hypothetical protein PLD88_03945, partial [Candidatus Berkiella sp.]|nr:hypothetical protein [Candidatus Berkiella sp.]